MLFCVQVTSEVLGEFLVVDRMGPTKSGESKSTQTTTERDTSRTLANQAQWLFLLLFNVLAVPAA